MAKSRAEILKLVDQLLGISTDRGNTEAEVMIAQTKATKLMMEYDLTFADLSNFERRKIIGEQVYGFRRLGFPKNYDIENCSIAVARMFGVRIFTTPDDVFVLFGTIDDTRFARNLLQNLSMAMETGFATYRRLWSLTGRIDPAIRQSWTYGFTNRVKLRIEELISERNGVTIGTELVVLKDEELRQRLRAEGIDEDMGANSEKEYLSELHGRCVADGDRAGSNVDLGSVKIEESRRIGYAGK